MVVRPEFIVEAVRRGTREIKLVHQSSPNRSSGQRQVHAAVVWDKGGVVRPSTRVRVVEVRSQSMTNIDGRNIHLQERDAIGRGT